MNKLKVGSDFSGVGAFDQALIRLGIDYETVFSCDMDKYARQTYIHNYGEPQYYPENVYDREIPKDSLDIYMTSPPCQSFSLAGKRKGKDSDNGVLFFNSHEFIQQNKPRYFIFENVKGLLSDDNGKTFSEWCNMLGGKSINGLPVLFPYDSSVPYHIYHKVLNTKKYGVPQNRERVFIIGIRDDADNNFTWPKEIPLEKRLKDVLEDDVDSKYFLSNENINKLIEYNKRNKEQGNGFGAKFHDPEKEMSALKVGGGGCDDLIKVKSATKKEDEIASTICASDYKLAMGMNVLEVSIAAMRGRETDNGIKQQLEVNDSGTSNSITTVQKDNLVIQVNPSKESGGIIIHNLYGGFGESEPRVFTDYSPAIRTASGGGHIPSTIHDSKIRRLTPRECFRLQDFPDSFTWPVSDSQAYKQAGNSITVAVLYNIVTKLLTNNS